MAQRANIRQGDQPKPGHPNPKPPTKTPGGPNKPTMSASRAADLRRTLADLQNQYHTEMGGAAYSGPQAVATRQWADAQLAAGAITQEQHDSFYASSHAMAQNFRKEQDFFTKIQDIQTKLGDTVSGFVPPGWHSTAQSILAGTAPIPSSDMQTIYPGVAAWLAAHPDAGANYQGVGGGVRSHGGGETASTSGTGFQPFTAMSGTQTGVPGYPVTQYQDAATAMTAAHTGLASQYASAAAAGDFASVATAQQAIAQHQALLPQEQTFSVTPPDTFDAADLYKPQTI